MACHTVTHRGFIEDASAVPNTCRRSAAAGLFGAWIPGVNTPGYRMPPLRGCAGWSALGFLGLTPQAIACRRSAAARVI